MTSTLPELDLTSDPVALTAALVDVASVSGEERVLADALERALRAQAPHLEVLRSGDAVLARTNLGRERRVLLAGHLDTVPIADNVPSRRADGVIHGCGTSDMKAGDAVIAHLAATLTAPRVDLTCVFYDCEEVEDVRNGLGRIEREHPDWLVADLAVLGEPTDGALEAGCQGTLRVEVRTSGRRAHSARSWLGDNAIHHAGDVLARLQAYTPRDVDIDGCVYKEGLQAVRVAGGVAGNVVPDECVVTVNFRFAPDRSTDAALAHVRDVFDGFDLTVTDLSAAALPGLSAPAAAEFVAATGAVPRAKYGWTDVSRFAALGIPAVNYGPGDPNLAHTREEHVAEAAVTRCADVLRRYLGPGT
ncbi:succinyl-diaminopimelate desuccinylase [Pseudonocardia sp. KRD291]|uniref:succinyl-diaminopimelate desuccinylase n=1 Tax=Pseudonocardia sp. KRD291 TaxID=2792007 RepID=UPI001C4A0BDC|nr:succinyl-diaminopimelate desuccinylase [Pseudonocardia sp. KRD291]MBW0104573.1 succinyl-diaminopimelate desuccinylase [Pseudonocardia sp. KRD291]